MFSLSEEQYQVFCRCQEDLLIDKMTRFLREEFPRETDGYSRMELDAIARCAKEKARSYGITNLDDMFGYLSFMILLGFNYDQDIAWAHDILTDSRIPLDFGKLRIQMLNEKFLMELK